MVYVLKSQFTYDIKEQMERFSECVKYRYYVDMLISAKVGVC